MYHFIFPQLRQSVHSDSSSLNSAVTMHKRKHKARKMSRRQRRSLERLYNKLRASGSTIIEDTNGEPPPRSPRKRKHDETSDGPNAKRTFTEESVIIIGDSDSQTPIKCKAPLVTSTPKNNHQRNVSQLNISNVTANSTPIVNNLSKNLSVQIEDLTKEINKSSYLTIDLTSETLPNSTCTEQTVIDLVNATENHEDCTVVTTENTEGCTIVLPDENSTNTSSASDITVVQKQSKALRKNIAREKKMREFADGISRMNATEKGQLLEMITEKIFSGCKVTNGLGSPASIKTKKSQAVETAEDTFIKEVILGQSTSRNSVGSNIYNPEREIKSKSGLRMVVIDGSNVAMSHGQHRVFSVKGLKICLDYFLKRGHIVKAFVPRFRCKFGKSTEPRLLDELERRGLVVYTPSREVQGKTITPYDDRYIVQCAAEFDGVIVSGDNYRDLLNENPRWRHIIETRLLQFTWVGDMIMFPKDPLGRYGPTLEEFLRHTPVSSHQVAS